MTRGVLSGINTIIMGQTSFEVMQSIGQASLDAATDFLNKAPVSHLILTADDPKKGPPIAKDGMLYASEEEAKKGLPIVQEQTRVSLTTIHQPEPIPEGYSDWIQKNVDAIHIIEREEGDLYRLPYEPHRALRHTHDPSDDQSSE